MDYITATRSGDVINPQLRPLGLGPRLMPHAQMGQPSSGMTGCATIGELLHLFCTTLQDQIKHRTYFYKSGTLVQEGMLVVNNAGLTGDPTSAKVEMDCRMLDFCVGLDTEFSEIHLYYPKTKFEQVSLIVS